MAQTKQGAIKWLANRAGVTVTELEKRIASGQKWCYSCLRWHPERWFGKDASRYDNLSPKCRECKRLTHRRTYVRKERLRGKSIVPARDGDKKQARRRINYFVEMGLMPHPNDLSCVDCKHVYLPGGRRHEYDHYLGYAAQNHERVEVVCSTCHRKREACRNNGH